MSLGTTLNSQVGIKHLEIRLLRIKVSDVPSTHVFAKGRTIYGTDTGTPPQVISHKNADGVTQYSALQELIQAPSGLGNFDTGVVSGDGSIGDPWVVEGSNAISPSATGGLQWGGTLSKDTAIRMATFAITFYKTDNTTPAFTLDTTGALFADNVRAPGVVNSSSPSNANVQLNDNGVQIVRNIGDGATVLRILNNNSSSTGALATFRRNGRNMVGFGTNGGGVYQGTIKAVAGVCSGHFYNDGLIPTANNDTLAGLNVSPMFASSTISSVDTSGFTPGSGYIDGSYNTAIIGGTGFYGALRVVVSGGVVTSVFLINGGGNYTNGETIGIILFDDSGSPVGSGFATTVTAITTFTGLTNYTAIFSGAATRFAPGTAEYGSIVLRTGITYTGTENGTMWQDGTGAFIRIGGATKQFTLT